MKAKSVMVAFLIAVLALVLVAGPALGKAGSITGGGWFNDLITRNKITFGLNARPTSDGAVVDAVGQFLLIDHGSKTRMRGTIDSMCLTEPTGDPPQPSRFWGEVSKDGDEEVPYRVDIEDYGEPGLGEGDTITILIDGIPTYYGELGGGNLKIHNK